MSLSPGTPLGPCEVAGLISAGAMGEVYRARDPRLGRDVAIKVLPASFAADAERLQRFETEARAAGALNHPNLVAVFDLGVAGGLPYVVEELLEGETLRQALAHGALGARRTVELATQVARGPAAAHERGIIHRDLKPENLFVTRDGRVKVLDFGLAKLLPRGAAAAGTAGDSLAAEVTASGMLLGTAGYMAPEQARGEPADHRSDLFALGVVMHEMLGGAKPFSRGSAVDTLHAILHSEPPELSGVPPALARIVQRCLEKEPTRRFQSASDLAFALDALSDPSGAAPAPALPAPARRRAPLAWVVGAVAVVAAAAGGFLLAASRAPTAPKFTRLTFRSGSIGEARFLPDGKNAVFDAQWDGRPPEIFQVPFDFPAARPLGLTTRQMLAVSPAGELALWRGRPTAPYFPLGGMLERVGVSGGSPRAVVDSVFWADFSPDGKALASVRFDATHALLEYPLGHTILASSVGLAWPRISPDGRGIACIENPVPNDDRGHVALVSRDGKLRRLTREFESVNGLAWSADGREIWFTAATSGIHRSLWSVRPGQPARQRLAAPTGLVLQDIARNGDALIARETIRNTIEARLAGDSGLRDLSWFDFSFVDDLSPDGRAILFDEESESAGALYSACMRRADDAGPVRLGDGLPIAFSPDGAWVLSFLPSNPQRVVLLPTGPGQPRTLDLGALTYLTVAGGWLPDGRHVLVCGNEAGKAPALWLLDAAGGPPKPASPEGISLPSRASGVVSRDGRRVFCLNQDAHAAVFDLESQSVRAVPGTDLQMRFVRWHPDGRNLVVFELGQDRTPVFRIELETGARQKLLEIPHAPWETITAVRMADDLKSYAFTTNSVLNDLYLMRGMR